MRAELEHAVQSAAARASGESSAPAPPAKLEPPKQAGHGDFATNWALLAAKALARTPRELAEALASALAAAPEFAKVEVAGPGFVNLWVAPGFLCEMRARAVASSHRRVLDDPGHFARPPAPERPQKINVEFVSVNPNGPVTVGSGRGAAYGSTLCNVLQAAGHEVHREYYVNDGVNSEQMRLFAESVWALMHGRPVPEGGYKGECVAAVAGQVRELEESGELALGDDPVPEVQRASQRIMLELQREDLARFETTFDTWFSEQSLHDSGAVRAALDHLVESGAADDAPRRTKVRFAKGGAIEEVESEPQEDADGPTLWLRSTKFGDDQDRVLRRRDGRLTYIASDVAYHADKFRRPEGADKLITVLGPDHHGYIGRLHAVVAAMLLAEGRVARPPASEAPLSPVEALIYASPEERDLCRAALDESRRRLEVQIFQLVRFLKEGKPAPMRKRDGNIYALADLVREIGAKARPHASEEEQCAVGKDVARFFYLMRHHDTTFDFDLDLAERESDENPVFYVQYAYARICGILRKAANSGLQPDPSGVPALHEKEHALLLRALDVAAEVERCAQDHAVNRLTTVALELARSFHAFYDNCRVVDEDDPSVSRSRLATCEAVRAALLAILDLLGVGAPESMERAAG